MGSRRALSRLSIGPSAALSSRESRMLPESEAKHSWAKGRGLARPLAFFFHRPSDYPYAQRCGLLWADPGIATQ